MTKPNIRKLFNSTHCIREHLPLTTAMQDRIAELENKGLELDWSLLNRKTEWSQKQKEWFVTNLLRGWVANPNIYISTHPDCNVLIDGYNRLCACLDFIAGRLKLKGLTYPEFYCNDWTEFGLSLNTMKLNKRDSLIFYQLANFHYPSHTEREYKSIRKTIDSLKPKPIIRADKNGIHELNKTTTVTEPDSNEASKVIDNYSRIKDIDLTYVRKAIHQMKRTGKKEIDDALYESVAREFRKVFQPFIKNEPLDTELMSNKEYKSIRKILRSNYDKFVNQYHEKIRIAGYNEADNANITLPDGTVLNGAVEIPVPEGVAVNGIKLCIPEAYIETLRNKDVRQLKTMRKKARIHVYLGTELVYTETINNDDCFRILRVTSEPTSIRIEHERSIAYAIF